MEIDEHVPADPDGPTRERVARSILVNGPSTAAALARAARPDPGRRTPPPRPAARGRHRRGPRAARSTAPAAAADPAKVFALTDAGRDGFDQQYDDLAVAGAAVPRRDRRRRGRARVRAPARRRSSRSASSRSWPTDPSSTRPRCWPGVFTDEGYAASVRARPGRRAAVPAALPGLPRRPRVPAAVRGRDRGDQPGPRPPRPAAGHHRPRRRCLHHLHPDCHQTHRPPTAPKEGRSMTTIEERNPELEGIGRYEFGWSDKTSPAPARSAASTRTSSATSPRRRASRSGCSTCA